MLTQMLESKLYPEAQLLQITIEVKLHEEQREMLEQSTKHVLFAAK